MKKDDKTYLFDKKANITKVLYAFYAFCAFLFAADFVVHRHTYHDWEKIPAFYALFGFGAYVIIVLSATVLRKLVMRQEDYYTSKEEQE